LASSRALELFDLCGELAVKGPGVDPNHPDPLLDEPQRAVPIKARLPKVLRRPPSTGCPGMDHDDVQGLQGITDVAQSLLKIGSGDDFAGLAVPHVEHDSWPEAPFQRDLVDAARGLALGRFSVVIRGVDVCGRVAADRQILNRPAMAIGVDEVLGFRPEDVHHPLQPASRMRHVLDSRLCELSGGIVLERDAEVDEADPSEREVV
jgi:hypothetical protein